MPKTTHSSPLAIAYAQSLLDLASEQNQAEPIASELAAIRELLDENPTFRAFLADPGISEQERGQTLKRIFEGQASSLMMQFLGVVNMKGRLSHLSEIASAYDELLGEKLGKIEVDVIVPQRLANDELERVRQSVSRALKRDAVPHQYVDESLIGGMVLRVQDKLIDASVKTQLDSLRRRLLAAKS
jgi:F-type H+-transporting ATPase subunit delta